MRIAIRPLTAPSNAFVQLFANAVAATGHEVVDFKDSIASNARNDIAIIHWPNEFLADEGRRRTIPRLARLRVARALGMKLVWVAHNRAAHDRAPAPPAMARAFLKTLDGIIYLSEASRKIIHEFYSVPSNIIECITVHGVYPPVTPASDYMPPLLGTKTRLASYGHIKPYKNFELIAALAAELAGTELHIFGMQANPDTADIIRGIALDTPSIHAEFVSTPFSDAEFEARIDDAHGVVLPYRDILNSGAALQALSRSRPVLVPAIGSLPELAHAVGPDWVHLYEGEIDRAAVERFVAALRQPRSPAPNLNAYEWSRVSADLATFFNRLSGGRG